MKKILYVAIAAAGLTLGASGGANATVMTPSGEAVRAGLATTDVAEKTHYRRWQHRHHRVCTWRHHRRVCWWR